MEELISVYDVWGRMSILGTIDFSGGGMISGITK